MYYKANKTQEGAKEDVPGRRGELYLLSFLMGMQCVLFRVYKYRSSSKWAPGDWGRGHFTLVVSSSVCLKGNDYRVTVRAGPGDEGR